MVEYILAFTALLVAVSALAYLLKAVRGSVVRTEGLISSDYP